MWRRRIPGSGGAAFKDEVRWHHAGRGREVKLYKSKERFWDEMHREGKEERESEEVRCRHGVGGRAGENRRKASIAGMCLVQRGEAVLHPPCLGERAKWGQEIRTF